MRCVIMFTLQGPNLAKMVAWMFIPGGPKFIMSEWAYNHHHWFSKIKFLSSYSLLSALSL